MSTYTPVSDDTKAQALKALDGMAQIVRNEMLVRGVYISLEVEDEERAKAGSVCRGHRACAIGSLFLGYGVKPRRDLDGDFELPGVTNRKRYTRRRPGLRLALAALDEATIAWARANRGGIVPGLRLSQDTDLGNVIEMAFETYHVDDREALLNIIGRARRIVRSA